MCQGYASEANAVKRHSLSTQASVLRQLPVLVGCSLRLKHTVFFFFSDVAPSTTATEIRSKMVMTMKEKAGLFFLFLFVFSFPSRHFEALWCMLRRVPAWAHQPLGKFCRQLTRVPHASSPTKGPLPIYLARADAGLIGQRSRC